jgi:hypothetical protein
MMKRPLFEEVEFEVEKEVWNIYELEDGNERVTLKMRCILTKIIKPRIMQNEMPLIGLPPETQPPKRVQQQDLNMSFQNLLVVSNCPPNLMGTPSPPMLPNELQQLPTEEIQFTPFYEDWNVYTLQPSGQKIKIKLVVSSVVKVPGQFEQFGYPLYLVQSTNAVAPVLPSQKKRHS